METTTQREQIDALKAKLAAARTPLERIALYNDPTNGDIAVRVAATVEDADEALATCRRCGRRADALVHTRFVQTGRDHYFEER